MHVIIKIDCLLQPVINNFGITLSNSASNLLTALYLLSCHSKNLSKWLDGLSVPTWEEKKVASEQSNIDTFSPIVVTR